MFKDAITGLETVQSHEVAEKGLAEKYLNIVEVIIVALDAQARITLLNRKGHQVLGYEEGELIGKDWIHTCLRPQDHQRVHEINRKIITGEIKAFEYYEDYVLTKKGEERFIAWHTTILKDDNSRIIGTLSSGEDITDRKQTEDALQRSEQEKTAILDGLKNVSVEYLDPRMNIIWLNNAVQKHLGLPWDEIKGRCCFEVIQGLKHPCPGCTALKALQTAQPQKGELITPDGKVWISRSNPIKDTNGNVAGVVHVAANISDRKKAEKALAESENKYRAIFENSGTAIMIIEDNTIISLANSELERFSGYSKEELEGKISWTEFVVKEDLERMMQQHKLRRTDPNAAMNDYEFRAIDRNGRVRDMLLRIDIIPGTKKSIASLLDITERKRVENELKWNAALLEAQVEASLDGILVVDEKGQRVITNQRLFNMWNVPEEIRNTKDNAPLLDYVVGMIKHPYQFLEKEIYLYNHHDETSRDVIEFKNGTVFDRYSSPVIGGDGCYYGRIWTFRDITDRKQAEDKIMASLQEKEVLLKEVHHRVKNNLQIISALLSLQSSYFTNEDIIEIFRDSQNRIKSMALVHENLYRSKDLGKVDFNEYINRLISHLAQSYGNLASEICFKVSSEDVYLNINTAIPCGMIINELISNSFKHAFPDVKRGEICINLNSETDGYRLVVSDDGVGFNSNLNIKESKTLGFRLIDTLVRQIDGKMSLDTINGTRCEINFKGLR